MHDSVMAFVAEALPPPLVRGARVLEVGSLDVNGSVRSILQPLAATYVGIDIRPGPGVDVVCDAARAGDLGTFDVVVSTEMLEHAESWQLALYGMTFATRLGGRLVLTTRGPGAGRHDHPGDYWRFTVPMLSAAMVRLGFLPNVWPDPGAGYTDGVFVRAVRMDPTIGSILDLAAEPAPV